MKNLNFACLLATLFLFGCGSFCDDYCERTRQSSGATANKIDITQGKYVEGHVIIPTKISNGVPRNGILRVFTELETPSTSQTLTDNNIPLRGVVFKNEDCPINSLYRPFYFTIIEENGIQLAKNISAELPKGAELLERTSSILENLKMDLHVEHEHTGAHTKIHVMNQSSGGSSLTDTQGNVYLQVNVKYENDPPNQTFPIYIQNYNATMNGNGIAYTMNTVAYVNNTPCYELTENHTHRFE